MEAAEQVVEDLVGGLGSRVTQREDDPVGPELRGLGQRPAGRSVLVSLGAQNAVNLPSRDGPNRRQGLVERRGGLRRIDPHIEILTLVHRFEVPGDVGDAFEPGDDRIQVDLQRPGECGGGEGMTCLLYTSDAADE